MNPTPTHEQDLIELLAEDELNSSERERLFRLLDQSQDGWKRCALALLESRSLGNSIRSLRDDPLLERTPPTQMPGKPLTSVRSSGLFRWTLAATATILLVAIGIAIGRPDPPHGPTVDVPAPSDTARAFAMQLENKDPKLLSQIRLAELGVPEGKLIAFIGTSRENQTRVYPVFESAELEKKLVDFEVPRPPSEFANQLKKTGWRVKAQKQLVSVQAEDGTRRTLPVGKLNYQYIGREVF